MFWIALGLAVVVGALCVVALLMLLAVPRTDAGWAWLVALGLLSVWVAFAVLSIGLNTVRGAEKGAAQAEAARGDRYEEHGRRAGRVVGKGLAAMTGRSSERAEPSADPAAPTSSAASNASGATSDDAPDGTSDRTRTDLDRGANSIGRMVGRRLAERRANREEDA